jgi:hypothetical protein
MLTTGYIECEIEDSITNAQSTALKSGYELKIKNEKNIVSTLSDVISQISSKYDLWNMSFRLEVIIDDALLFYFYRHVNVYDWNLNPHHQLHDFTPYYGEEEANIGEGKISIEINLSAEFAESLIFMSSYEKEKVLRPIKDLFKRTDIIVNFDVSGGGIYLEVPIEVEVTKYII